MRGEQLRLFNPDNDSGSRNRRRLIIIPLDTFILSSVVVILLFILAFSLGVERGRKSSYNNLEDKENLEKGIAEDDPFNREQVRANIPASEVKKESAKPAAVTNAQTQATRSTVKTETVAKTGTVTPATGDHYCVQLASYNKVDFAQGEAKQLQAKGFPVFILKKGDFAVLYVGVFKTKAEAEKSMGLLKKTYKDCVLRRLQ